MLCFFSVQNSMGLVESLRTFNNLGQTPDNNRSIRGLRMMSVSNIPWTLAMWRQVGSLGQRRLEPFHTSESPHTGVPEHIR